MSEKCLNSLVNMKHFVYFVGFVCLYLGQFSTGTIVLNGTNNATVKKRSSYMSQIHLTQSERNRRLIPYTTHYVSANQEHGSTLHSTHESGNREREQTDYVTTPKPRPPIVVGQNMQKAQYDYIDYQPTPITGYNYVPVAYIPGNPSVPYTPNAPYYPPYYHEAALMEGIRPYTTARPQYLTSTIPSTGKKESLPYPNESLLPSAAPQNAYIKYVVPTVTRHQKPSTVSNSEANKQSYSPVLFTTQQPEYLPFRYSELYKTLTPKYEPPTTTPVVEITSPKHYNVPKAPLPAATKQVNLAITTPSYSLAYDYPEAAQFAYAAPLTSSRLAQAKAIPLSYVEQATQSSRTISKTQEVPMHPKPSSYHVEMTPKPYENIHADSISHFTVDDIFKGYNLNKQLPERITPENIKESIKTLSYILEMLQKADSITQFHQQPGFYSKNIFDSLKEHSFLQNEDPKSVNSLQNVDSSYETYDVKEELIQHKPSKDESSTPGRAGIDYPIYEIIPQTSFTCKTQRYKGFFADPETKCQVWHYCDLNGGQASFLCPNGTIFNQAALTCDWWFNVKCASTVQLYVLNERLYKYIIPVRPSFPEDFSGPLVDQYLTEKFKETESQRKHKYPTNSSFTNPEPTSALNLTALSEYDIPMHLLNQNL